MCVCACGFLRLQRPPLPLRRTSGLCCLAIVLGTQYGIRSGLFEVASFAMLAMMVVIRREKLSVRFSAVRHPPPSRPRSPAGTHEFILK